LIRSSMPRASRTMISRSLRMAVAEPVMTPA
jgi:hypothetical protein